MQSDGGLTPMEQFCGSRAILSGPAGGVVGYGITSYSQTEKKPVIGFDMGGESGECWEILLVPWRITEGTDYLGNFLFVFFLLFVPQFFISDYNVHVLEMVLSAQINYSWMWNQKRRRNAHF